MYDSVHRKISATGGEYEQESETGWDNPFHPSGSVSADADLIVRLWKERRLDKRCGEEGGIIPSIPLVV